MGTFLTIKKSVYISIGSNLGNKINNCCNGIYDIEENRNSSVIRCSNFYLTSPTDYKPQGWFVNVAVKIETALDPFELLDELSSIQRKHGRGTGSFRFGPRKLDLDIIFYEDEVLESPTLEIPHPRMHERLFVLRSICDIDPGYVHPVFKVSVKSILDNILDESQRVIPIGNSGKYLR